MKTCKWVLQQILNILEKGVNTEQERDKILQLIETFRKKRIYISVSLEKFEELCTTACYNPEILLDKSKCAKLLLSIEEEITKHGIPLPEKVRIELIQRIKSFLEYIERRYSEPRLKRLKSLEERLKRLEEENGRLRELLRRFEEENRQLRERVVCLHEEREILRKRVHALSEKVRELEGELQYLRQGLDTYVLQGKKLDRILTEYSRLVEEEFNYLTIIARYRALYETYLSLAASLANTVSRLLEENAVLLSMVSRLREEVEVLRCRVQELEDKIRMIIETARQALPEKVRRRIVEELRRSMLQ